ncbi:MAG TPA: penicillin-binding transpeptidase domain-containing protein, partial [Bacteroidia bacterium]|nr:penicillin-binding transpeptidase domain-containing protein [Bacteroidia bacterium]
LSNKVPHKYWKKQIRKAKYGKVLTEKLDGEFWNNGQFVISSAGQIDFLKRLNSNKLPFKNKYCQWAKKLMLIEEDKNYKLYAKTGLQELPDKNVGWFIGFIEKPNGIFYFATTIESTLPVPESFSMSRVYITKKILADLGIIVSK